MKHALSLLAVIGLFAALTGCALPHGRGGTGLMRGSCQAAPEGCADCDGDGCHCAGCDCDRCREKQCYDPDGRECLLCPRGRCRECASPGPASGAITYPYYTTRGPRDFLARSPRTIGP